FLTVLFLRLFRSHRYLHSFPTRRSSDLAPVLQQEGHGPADRAKAVVVVVLQPQQALEVMIVIGQQEPVDGIEQAVGGGLDRHRRSEEHTSELQSRENLVCRLLLEKTKTL